MTRRGLYSAEPIVNFCVCTRLLLPMAARTSDLFLTLRKPIQITVSFILDTEMAVRIISNIRSCVINLRSFLGTVMRIDPAGNNSKNGKYGIPADNPFVNETDPLAVKEIYAYGFRNPHRLTWDPTNNNRLMVTDIGEANIEELNIVEKGGDYGWPNREGNFGITTTKDMKTVYKLSTSDLGRFEKPFAQYDHQEGNAISGGFVYEGNLTPLKNKYVFSDIVNGRLFYVNIDPALTDSTVYELTVVENGKETTLQEMSHTKRLHQRVNYDRFTKELYVITKADGKIRRVSKAY